MPRPARGTTYTSATTQRFAASLSSRCGLSFAPDFPLTVGGLPIGLNARFLGDVAVSLATPDIDEKCREAGIKSVADSVNFVEQAPRAVAIP